MLVDKILVDKILAENILLDKILVKIDWPDKMAAGFQEGWKKCQSHQCILENISEQTEMKYILLHSSATMLTNIMHYFNHKPF